MKIKDIINYLEEIAPLSYQEDYDNSGLIIGDKEEKIKGVLITLDCTEDVVNEAINNQCNLIITHHPIIFKGLKKINNNNYIERTVITCIKNNISVYAIHTNLDNIYDGVNARIAEMIGLRKTKILSPKNDLLRQLVVYCPVKESDILKDALFTAGAGSMGNYEKCSFSLIGTGSFHPNQGADPFVGKKGKMHFEKEKRIEVVYPKYKEREILLAMHNSHPYEEIAYQIYVLENKYKTVGAGVVGALKTPVNSLDFIKHVKKIMKSGCIKHTEIVKKKIKKVAICGGSGSFLLHQAIASNSDIFITSDFKYHEFFNADKRIIIADIGHYESEQFTKDLIYDLLVKKFTKFAIRLSKINTNPINYL